jgi:hypothetical protein
MSKVADVSISISEDPIIPIEKQAFPKNWLMEWVDFSTFYVLGIGPNW